MMLMMLVMVKRFFNGVHRSWAFEIEIEIVVRHGAMRSAR